MVRAKGEGLARGPKHVLHIDVVGMGDTAVLERCDRPFDSPRSPGISRCGECRIGDGPLSMCEATVATP